MSYRTYSTDPHWIYTRYTSVCARCGRTIAHGERAWYYPRGKRLYCGDPVCGAQEARDFAAAAADEAMYNA